MTHIARQINSNQLFITFVLKEKNRKEMLITCICMRKSRGSLHKMKCLCVHHLIEYCYYITIS